MSKNLVLEIPDYVYEPILKRAEQNGQSPQQLILKWLEEGIQKSSKDPLLQLAGILTSDITDISEEHDKYIGQSLISSDE